MDLDQYNTMRHLLIPRGNLTAEGIAGFICAFLGEPGGWLSCLTASSVEELAGRRVTPGTQRSASFVAPSVLRLVQPRARRSAKGADATAGSLALSDEAQERCGLDFAHVCDPRPPSGAQSVKVLCPGDCRMSPTRPGGETSWVLRFLGRLDARRCAHCSLTSLR